MPKHVPPHANGKVLDDEIVIVHSSGSIGEPEVFEPNVWVCLPGVFGDVGGRSKMLWEQCPSDALAEDPWPRTLRAGAPVVRPVTVPGSCFTASLNGLVGIYVARRRVAVVVAMLGTMPVAEDATSVLVRVGPLVCQRSVWSRRLVGPRRGCRTPS